MKIQYRPEKPHSWLEYPVKLKELASTHSPHITVKFFDKAHINPRAVERKCEEIMPYIPWEPKDFRWEPKDFRWETKIWTAGPGRDLIYVLALTRCPAEINNLHRAFDLIKDQHSPYNPHITVPKAFFFLVEDQKLTPEDCELEIGEVTLVIGGADAM